jgi:hypothetical protein
MTSSAMVARSRPKALHTLSARAMFELCDCCCGAVVGLLMTAVLVAVAVASVSVTVAVVVTVTVAVVVTVAV